MLRTGLYKVTSQTRGNLESAFQVQRMKIWKKSAFPGRRTLAQKEKVREYIPRARDKLYSQNESTF